MRSPNAPLAAIALCTLVLVACSTADTTTTTTTETVRCVEVDPSADEPEPSRECTTITKKTETTKRPPECHGVLSCTFYVVGEAIALPFRLLGAALNVVS